MANDDMVTLTAAAKEKGFVPSSLAKRLIDNKAADDMYVTRRALDKVPPAQAPGRRGPDAKTVKAFQASLASAGITLTPEAAATAYSAWLASRNAAKGKRAKATKAKYAPSPEVTTV